MYTPYKGGTVEKIEGIDIYVPPIGKVWNPITDNLDQIEILFKHLPKKDQYWRPTELPDKWKELRKEEKKIQESDPDYFNPKLEAFREQEWHRRLSGVWFMNNGKPTYITGLHYFYLCYWKIDIGLPTFRMPDRELFLFVQYCVEDPNCLGLIEVTKRKQGKTFRAGVFSYEYISRTKNAYGGIQSKTGDDARDQVFSKSIITPFKHLPDFFRPVYDTAKGVTPKTELKFFHTTKKGKASLEEERNEEELESIIDWKTSGKFGYDGPKLHRYIGDEVGKTVDIDVKERHDVVKFCCMVDEDIIGKMYYTTTVEDRESGGEAFEKLWDDSNFHEKNANGRTRSGLYRYFLPAYKTMYFDKYGIPDEEKAKDFFRKERDALKDDPQALASFIRKNPFTIEEAFITDGEDCVFNAMVLNERLGYLNLNPNVTNTFDFEWENGVDGNVQFVENTVSGKFEVAWFPAVEDRNKVSKIFRGGVEIFKPQNDSKFCIGCDPISYGKTVDSRKSKAAAYVFRKFDINADHGKNERDYESHNFVVEYLHRPQEPEIFYEDMIKLCRFFGCQILVENQKNNVLTYFKQRGYEEFIMHRPETTFTKDGNSQDVEGIPSSSVMIDTYTGRLQTFTIKHGHRIKFKRLIKDMLLFDPSNPRVHDATVGAGFALLAREKIVEEDLPPIQVEELFNTYDNTGTSSSLSR